MNKMTIVARMSLNDWNALALTYIFCSIRFDSIKDVFRSIGRQVRRSAHVRRLSYIGRHFNGKNLLACLICIIKTANEWLAYLPHHHLCS